MFYLVKPVLHLVEQDRQKAQGGHDNPKEGQNQAPYDDSAKVIFSGFVFTKKGPDDNHNNADAGQSHYEQGEEPEPE